MAASAGASPFICKEMSAAEATYELSAAVWRERKLYVAWCPEVDVASQGKGVDEALANLKEALEL